MAKSPSAQVATPQVSTAGKIKYADPRSLPSYPSSGLNPDGAAASAAASLGWSNQKTIEPWRPNKTSSASAAAVLAKDYKMSPSWEHQADSAGQRAALLAVGSAGAALKQKSPSKSSRPQDGWGNSAASQAFRANRPLTVEPANLSHGSSAATQAFNTNRSLSVKKTEPQTTSQADRSLAAAKGAMSSRPRSISSPSSPRSKATLAAEASAASSALNGATLAHRASLIAKPPIQDVGAISVTTMTRNMFTSHPPVKPEIDEQADNERIHQSAVEMAKKMYQQQQKWIDQAKDANPDEANAAQSSPYLNLQDAAYKQAQERLARLHDEHQRNREYQEYYGKEQQQPRRRFSMAAKLRRRSSSDGDIDDKQRSEKIREQMSMFSSQLSQVDKGKRDKDREALLAAAQRNVKARLQGMDEKVYQDTGKTAPTRLSDWEVKAQQAAQTRHDTRTSNRGKIDIGGGRFMDPSEIEAIASKRIQPMLDDINEKAEAERERIAVLKLEEEARRAEAEKLKSREREIKDLEKKAREQEKQEERTKRQLERNEEKARKDEEKALQAEQKRQAKEERRKSKQGTAATAEQTVEPAHDGDVDSDADAEHAEQEVDIQNNEGSGEEGAPSAIDANIGTDNIVRSPHKADGPSSPTSKVKGWIKNRFSRGKSVGEQDKKRKSFLGGLSAKIPATRESTASLENRSTSMRDIAVAGKTDIGDATSKDVESHHIADNDRGISPVSTQLEDEENEEDGEDAVNNVTGDRKSRSPSIESPKAIEDVVPRTSISPARDSRFREMMDH